MATKITTRVLADDAVTDAKIADVTLTTATQAASDNTTKIATTAYVTTAIANLADSAPSTLNTLNELAAALGDDANYATTTTNAIAAKAPLAGPTFTGDVDIAGSDDLRLRFLNGSTFKGGIQVPTSTDDMISGAAVDDLAIRSQANMLFSTGGNTERMRIDSTGKIQIGNNIPMWSGEYGGALFLKGNNSTADRFAEITTVDSNGATTGTGLVVKGAGATIKAGIGTNSPILIFSSFAF